MNRSITGIVYLVGAGPGDPQLITVKGLNCIHGADVIIYDRLTNEILLDAARLEAEKIYAGKSSSGHTMTQNDINSLLISRAKEGKKVVRLKGGDPFLFGRGGEEAIALSENDVPFEVIPGVTSATAVPAYAGIPVTHRNYASSISIITGHEDPSKETSSIAWDKIATGSDTLVFLMGVEHLPQIVDQLVANGRKPSTPVAIIEDGTTPRQRTIKGTLEDIIEKASVNEIKPPAVIVVGEVIELSETLRWYDSRPLFGKRVLVTRSRQQASRLSTILASHGAQPVESPTIIIDPVQNYGELDKVIAELSSYNWVIFTSSNGVKIFFDRLTVLGMDARALKGVSICAIGPSTSIAIEQRGITVDYMPREYISEAIADGFKDMNIKDARILLPRSAEARPELVSSLCNLGALVDEIAIYTTVVPAEKDTAGKRMLLNGEIDIITFTSSSTVRNLASLIGG
jgi:uroporphyrinogen III methyltransferase/synthase